VRLPTVVLVTALCAGKPGAQTVHMVGPGGFAQIQAAINAAANGDVVVIQSGTYAAFTLAKDLTLTAAPGAIVDVSTTTILTAGVTVLQPPTSARLAGLRFRASTLLAPFATRVLGGTVYCEDCAFESQRYGFAPAPGLLVQNARVALQRCVLIGGGVASIGAGSGAGYDGMQVVNASVAAVDCLFLGGNLAWDFIGRAGHGVLVDGADVQLANCFVAGGDNAATNPVWPPGDGVRVASPARVWIADCAVRGGNGHTSPGGTGFANLGTAAAQEARSTFVGGAGTPSGASVVGSLASAPLLGLAGPTPPLVLGATWTIGLVTTPATPVLALWSDRLAISLQPIVVEPVWLPIAAFAVAGAGLTDANGLLTFSFAIPSTASLLHAACFVQAFGGLALPLEAAPPVGGTIR